MKRNVIIAVVFFLVGIIFYSFWVRPDTNQLRVVVENVDEVTSLYSIHVSYPQFPDLPKEFNKKIKTTFINEITLFKIAATENMEARKETAQKDEDILSDLTYTSGWSAEQLNKNLVSVVAHTLFYQGGAHGGQKIYTFSFDVKNKHEVTLDSLFGKTKNYLEKISQFTLNDLKSQLQRESSGEPNMGMLQEGTSPKLENFSRFTVGSAETLTFYFEEYQVAPYAAGEKQVIMPISYITASTSQTP